MSQESETTILPLRLAREHAVVLTAIAATITVSATVGYRFFFLFITISIVQFFDKSAPQWGVEAV